jgi:hypothetical protein
MFGVVAVYPNNFIPHFYILNGSVEVLPVVPADTDD